MPFHEVYQQPHKTFVAIRRSLIDNPRSRFIDKFLENRRAHLATVTSD
ncbi:hypothetical protein ZEAMMB73_Zm00001d028518 [Zea mays]|uniref:Uncharacterized protein n=1 Tax=Zea mays TaxID=4577 RepID=A0A1D6JX20_MAIZE|nr:hypothetical protein ZEAMMB73_Zm00001d028518 [Zea mays]